MAYKYQDLMKEYKISLDSPVLDPAFVSKVQEFETKSAQLTDEELVIADQELCEMFTNLHELGEEENEETKKANRKAEIAEAKVEIAEANTLEELNNLAGKYIHLSDVQVMIEKKIKKLTDLKADEELKQFIDQASQAISSAKYEELSEMRALYEAYPDLITAIDKRLDEEAPAKQKSDLRTKLLEKREWDYNSLKAIGITPTGDNMTIEGVFLERQYLYKIYKIKAVDGTKV